MVLTILDFKEVELPADATVEEVYEIAKIGRARFYLSSELLTQEKTTSKETQPHLLRNLILSYASTCIV